jgi:ornithine cyclodeaminase
MIWVPTRVGFVGTGLIARYIHTFLAGTGWSSDEIGVHDLSADIAAGFRGYLEEADTAGRITVHEDAEQLIRSSDLVVFATIAAQAHVRDLTWFAHNPVVLHVSLRDLAPEIVLASTNIVDDVDHCLKADTSPHLAEQLTGNRDFTARHVGRRDGRAVGGASGPPGGVLAFRPRSARSRRRQIRLRRGDPLGRSAHRRRLLPRNAPVRMSGRVLCGN